jgi:hypothetical protein
MDVADDVEWTMLLPLVVVQRHALHRDGFNFLGRVEHKNVAKALFGKATQIPAQLRLLLANNVRAEVSLVTVPVSLLTNLLRQVEDNRDRQAMILSGKIDEWLASFGLHIGRVNDGQSTQGEPLSRDEVKYREGSVRDGLIVFLVADHGAASVGRQYLGRQEVLAREGAFARSAWADQDDKGQFGDRDLHGMDFMGCSHNAFMLPFLSKRGPTKSRSGATPARPQNTA